MSAIHSRSNSSPARTGHDAGEGQSATSLCSRSPQLRSPRCWPTPRPARGAAPTCCSMPAMTTRCSGCLLPSGRKPMSGRISTRSNGKCWPCSAGVADVLAFAPDGTLTARHRLDPEAPVIQIPVGTWHAAVALQPGTIVMEIKPGPYRANEFADWTPEEITQAAAYLLDRLERQPVGSLWA